MINITVTKNESGQRFDKLLMKILKEAPPSFVYKMLRKKNITLNGRKAEGPEKVQVGDSVSFFLADETFNKFAGKSTNEESAQPATVQKNVNLKESEIIYEDEDVLIVDKPVGELSQKAEENDVSVNERIVAYLSGKGIGVNEAFKPGICNRIDRNTSGLVTAGKTLVGLQELSRLFKEHDLKKFYLCIVCGDLKNDQKIRAFITKDEKNNKVAVYKEKTGDSEMIEAEYHPLLNAKGYTLTAVRLITGKPHQIRAHLSYLGFPLIGDVKYGYRKEKDIRLSHQLLHAFLMIFPKNTGELKAIAGKAVMCMPPAEFEKYATLFFGKEEYRNAVLEFERSQRF